MSRKRQRTNSGAAATIIAPNNTFNEEEVEHDEQQQQRLSLLLTQEVANNDEPESSSFVAAHGFKQLTRLRQAVVRGTIYRTQGRNWKSQRVPKDDLLRFLESKVDELRNNRPQESTFAYIERHIVGTVPSFEELSMLRELLGKRFGSHCRVSSFYPQCKIPTSDVAVSNADRKNNKEIGLVQVQAYLLAYLLMKSNGNLGRFQSEIDRIIAGGEEEDDEDDDNSSSNNNNKKTTITTGGGGGERRKVVAAHLCKRVCLTSGHVLVTSHGKNKQQDYCPAWWIVNGNPVCFCTCTDVSTSKCLAPGPKFDASTFGHALTRAVGGFKDPILYSSQK